MGLRQENEILLKALGIAVKDVNKLLDRLTNGLYIPMIKLDYIEEAKKVIKNDSI